MDYDEIIRQLTHIEDEGDDRWEIEEILDHKWNPKKKGRLLILIKWKALEEPSWEPMEIIKEDDPITLAEYAKDHNLLEQTKWKWAKRYLQFKKRSINHLTKVYAKKNKSGPKYQFGEQVPRTVKEAYDIDSRNRTTGWTDAIEKELKQLVEEYSCFKILGKGEKAPPGYIYIPLLWIFAVKFDGKNP